MMTKKKMTRNVQLGIESLEEIRTAILETGLSLLEENQKHLLAAGISKAELQQIEQEIQQLRIPTLAQKLDELKSSGVYLSKVEIMEILYTEQNIEAAQQVEADLVEQGFVPEQAVGQALKVGNHYLATVKRTIGSDRVA